MATYDQNIVGNFGGYPFASDNASGITRSGAAKYPNPFCDIASEYVPRDLTHIFEWMEYLFLTFGTYRAAAQRCVRYFLTDIEMEGASDDELDDYKKFLKDDLHIMQALAEIGDEYMVYGQSFFSLYFPFDRFLICPNCHIEYHFDTVEGQYKFMPDGRFIMDCPKCGARAQTMIREDRRSPEKSRVKVIRWNPKMMRLRVHPVSWRIEYYMLLDPLFVQRVRTGVHFYLKDTPWSVVETCLKALDQQYMYKFKENSIYHLRCTSLAGLPIRAWAIPPMMANFKLAYYIALLRRYDEAIALDFIVPFRVLYPKKNGPQGEDPLSTMSMGNFISHMRNLVESKRKNITDIQIAPFEIGYEMLGGEAKALAPKDNIALALDELLNAIGFPAELYKGSLSIQAFPVALRLFEKTWNVLVSGYNDALTWMVDRISKHYMWGDVKIKLRSVTLADDIELKALSLQAAAGMDISKGTAYRPLGIDFLEEQRRALEEQQAIQQLQQEAMEEQQAAQFGMGGGAAQGQGGQQTAVGATPGDVYEQGKALAQQLLLQTPETQRRGELIKIKHSNPTLHAIVLQEMDNMRQQMASQGQAMIMQQSKTAEALSEARKLPSPTRIALEIADQIFDYSRGDLRKMAMSIKRNEQGAKDAFHFIYLRIRGLA